MRAFVIKLGEHLGNATDLCSAGKIALSLILLEDKTEAE